MTTSPATDPLTILGVSPDASEAEVRARYLELVKKYPPEQNSEKFLEIRQAFEAAKDPLVIAQRLIAPPSEEVPPWSDVLKAQQKNPPRFTSSFLLSLGNRVAGDSATEASPDNPLG
jgi:hypothetical protein